MSRHARDHEAILDEQALWSKMKPGDDVFVFTKGDVTYTIRRIDCGQNKFIADSQFSGEKVINAGVRYILADDLEILEVHYILGTDASKPRCPICKGINISYKNYAKQEICDDCGYQELGE